MHPSSNKTTHFFTVDVEEYFQVKALESAVARDQWLAQPSRVAQSVDNLLEVLDRHASRGTFFVLGWIAEHHPEVVRAIAGAGHEIASHGFSHERVTDLGRDDFRDDVRRSKVILERVSGTPVLGYRAPSFSIVPGYEWALDTLLEEGYRYDSSLFPIHRKGYGYPSALHHPYAIHRPAGAIAEFPLATTTIMGYPFPAAGGGYIRHFPFAIIRRAFREATDRGTPATFYIHPWEIDPDQPQVAVSHLNRIRHYRGLNQTLPRIERLLTEFRFDTIMSYLPTVEDGVAPRVTAGAA